MPDISQLLQMLMRGQGGGESSMPVSGLQPPVPLSGIPLGAQGEGIGSGQTLMGGGQPGGMGADGGGPSLDLFQLLAQLQGAGGGVATGGQTPLGQGGFGGGLGGGFGAGGQLQPAQSMQAGLGGGGGLSSIQDILDAIRLGRSLSSLFPGGPEGQPAGTAPGGSTSSPEILRGGNTGFGELGPEGAVPGGQLTNIRGQINPAFIGGGLGPEGIVPAGQFTNISGEINPAFIGGGGAGGGANAVPGVTGATEPEVGGAATAGTGAASKLGANLGTAGVVAGLGSSIAQDDPRGAFASALGGLALGLGNPILAAPFAITSILDALPAFATPDSPENTAYQPLFAQRWAQLASQGAVPQETPLQAYQQEGLTALQPLFAGQYPGYGYFQDLLRQAEQPIPTDQFGNISPPFGGQYSFFNPAPGLYGPREALGDLLEAIPPSSWFSFP